MTDLLGQYAERQFQVMRATHFELPKLWEACTEGLATTGQLLEDVSKELRSAQRDRLGVWGSLRLMQVSSVLQLFSRNLDEGLVLLRVPPPRRVSWRPGAASRARRR
jgi:hypothetical protein